MKAKRQPLTHILCRYCWKSVKLRKDKTLPIHYVKMHNLKRQECAGSGKQL